jgi:hypothetical protein
MRVVVDNRTGTDAQLAKDVAGGLEAEAFEVEVRNPEPASKHDTSVHLLSAGLVLRVLEQPQADQLRTIEGVVRKALGGHRSLRRRNRAVPVHLGEGARVLRWIDVFD